MTADLMARPLVPIAGTDDAIATYRQLRPYLLDSNAVPLVVYVIETAGGAPDKAGVEQRRAYGETAFEAFRNRADPDGVEVETKILYGTDVAEVIHDAAAEFDASAIAFRSRGKSRWPEFLSGNVRSKLITGHDRPVVVLPKSDDR